MKVTRRVLTASLILGLLLTGCGTDGAGIADVLGGSDKTMHTSTIFAMDTVMELEVYGHEDALPGAEELIRELEKKLSVTDEKSEIYALNLSNSAQISEDTAELMEGALDICERTSGALDITIYPVLKAWGFTTGEYRVPNDAEIEELLGGVDYRNVVLGSAIDEKDGAEDAHLEVTPSNDTFPEGTPSVATIPQGTQVDLGSVAKGYTGSKVIDYFKEQGVKSALINLGGNVQCLGSKPNGDKWNVAIKSPFEDSTSGVLGIIQTSDKAIITSGGYERYFEEDGEVYWHILDPKTGKPAKNGLVSVTVIGDDGLKCDGFSTALFVEGLDNAINTYRSSDDFEAVFVTEERKVYVTEGIADSFSLSSEYYDLELEVIYR